MDSFFRFMVGFLVFIAVSFGVTAGVNIYTSKQDVQRQTAAAMQAFLTH